jgi:DNA helicase-2/ATP-dependent DNA helicase PcrA
LANKIDYEKVLNPAQLEAVMTLNGPVLVIAGAGSGKTRTLVYRVARLVETGVPPESILLLTFTRKAAQEMLDRASQLSDARCRFVSGGTFHSLSHQVLRSHAEILGYKNSFTVLDRSDMEEVIQSLIPELGVPMGTPRLPKRRTLANILSKAANLEQPFDELMAEEYGQFLEFLPYINRLGRIYKDYKKAHYMMDYDDLILYLRQLLVESEGVRENLSRRYHYVMVDEYQDTNTIQADIAKWLAHDHRNIMVVGDDSQSIYSFRGANYRNMFDFSSQFPGARTIKLEENYRSTQPVLTFTNAIMDRASEKFTKCLFTKRTGGEPPKVMYGGFKFLESAHIKDFLAHLRVVVNRDDTVSWVRILRLVKNVGRGKSQAIIRWMQENRISPGKIGGWPGTGKKDSGLRHLSELISRLAPKGITPGKAAEQVMEYYVPVLKEKFDDYPKRKRELEQLIPMAGRYSKLRGFLDDLVLEPPTSSGDINPGEKAESLTLSTIHSAKGLEWPVVLIIWIMEGRFPPSRAYNNPMVLEEERRLMYVAATRAKDQLIMCYPGRESAALWSTWGSAVSGSMNGVSSFIQGLPEEIVSYESAGIPEKTPGSERKRKTPYSFKRSQSKKYGGISVGDRVNHPAFGPGVVSKFIADDKVEVLFRKVGRKLLHMEYTTLEKI